MRKTEETAKLVKTTKYFSKDAIPKYFSIKRLMKENCELNLIFGGRSNGKSFAIKEFCLQEALENDIEFGYLRRFELETKPSEVVRYFNDLDIPSITNGKADSVTSYAGDIYFSKVDDKLHLKRVKKIGSTFFIGGYTHYMSLAYPKIMYLIFEEFFSKTTYEEEEVDHMLNILSTVFRERKGKVFMIGNPETKVNPYLEKWGITNYVTKKMKENDFAVFEVENGLKLGIVKVPNEVKSGMIFANTDKINKGLWDTLVLPTITLKPQEYEIVLKIKYESVFDFIINRCVNLETGLPFTIVKPCTRTINYADFILNADTAPHSGIFTFNNLSYKPMEFLENDICNNNVMYATRECGTDFLHCMKKDKFI